MIPKEVPLPVAATLCINPPTAVCMLTQFEQLKEGDVVVQNGATSAVGQHVIQLAKAKGWRTVNIIRDRPDWDDTVSWLKGMGADLVTTEDKAKKELAASGLPPPALGLNCVGGSAAAAVAKLIREGGTMVTYGAMSMQPLTLPASLLIFKDIQFKGFWLSGRWAKKAGPEGRAKLMDEVAKLYMDGTFVAPQVKEFKLEEFKDALAANKAGYRHHKVVFAPVEQS